MLAGRQRSISVPEATTLLVCAQACKYPIPGRHKNSAQIAQPEIRMTNPLRPNGSLQVTSSIWHFSTSRSLPRATTTTNSHANSLPATSISAESRHQNFSRPGEGLFSRENMIARQERLRHPCSKGPPIAIICNSWPGHTAYSLKAHTLIEVVSDYELHE